MRFKLNYKTLIKLGTGISARQNHPVFCPINQHRADTAIVFFEIMCTGVVR